MFTREWLRAVVVVMFTFAPMSVSAEVPWQFADNTRYMAMGDSLAAGYGAIPATQGYAYLLYKEGVFDKIPNTLLSNVGLIGATSDDVLKYQVPLAIRYEPTVITLTVGGNDLAPIILGGANKDAVLATFKSNLTTILEQLGYALLPEEPELKIYINNLYDIPEIPGATDAVLDFNVAVSEVAAGFNNVYVADVFAAFEGRKGLRLIQRNGAFQYEVHPSNAGHRAIAKAFKAVIEKN